MVIVFIKIIREISVKAAGYFLILMGFFGIYVLKGLNDQNGFKRGPYTNNSEIIRAEDVPNGFNASRGFAGLFTFFCFTGGVYLIRKKK